MDREQMIATLELHGWRPVARLCIGARPYPTIHAALYNHEHGLIIDGELIGTAYALHMNQRPTREWSAVPDLPVSYRLAMEASCGSRTNDS